jgi:ABC-type uncharacterized transport system substrate-binding protein
MKSRAAIVAVLAGIAPAGATAHPHVFVDMSARFVLSGDNRLTAGEIVHLHDPLFSMFVLHDLGVDLDGPLPASVEARLVADNRAMLRDEGAFATLAIDGGDVALRPAEDVTVRVEDGRLRVSFRAPLETPEQMAGGAAMLSVYDKTYLIAFDLTGGATVQGGTGCAAEKVDWAAAGGWSALWTTLFDLESDPVPLDFDPARMSAAKARLRCP